MLSCRQVSNALEQDDYANLNWFSRRMLKLHVALCVVCGKYNRQRMIMHDTIRELLSREDQEITPDEGRLTDQERENMKQVLKQADR